MLKAKTCISLQYLITNNLLVCASINQFPLKGVRLISMGLRQQTHDQEQSSTKHHDQTPETMALERASIFALKEGASSNFKQEMVGRTTQTIYITS